MACTQHTHKSIQIYAGLVLVLPIRYNIDYIYIYIVAI